MLLKYNPLAVPQKNERHGFVFQSSDKFKIATVAKRNDRARYVRQHQRQLPLMASNQHWRNLPANVKAKWSSFATAFPEPTKANPDVFLTGYQLFCKRQQYVFLNGGIAEPWLLNPLPPELDVLTFNIAINAEEHCIDVTELYLQNFGILPKKGQFLFIKIIPYQTAGGKFYPIYSQTIEVDEVYIDGLFVSISFPKTTKGVTFSVFLSFPVSHNALYQSSKIRYMGCFTVKSFLDLSDTPDSYEDQHGKFVTVKADETGLEFTDPPSGGLSCADLINCPTIISIIGRLNNLENTVSIIDNTSIPPVNYGSLFPVETAFDSRLIYPAGWHIPTLAEWNSIFNSLGGQGVACNPMREVGADYWLSPNTGATNLSKFNARGAGYINGVDGSFRYLQSSCTIFCADPFSAWDHSNFIFRSNAAYVNQQASSDGFGFSLRLVKDFTTLANGQQSTMQGNDLKTYRTVCIGGVEIMADNSNETKFRDGFLIPLAESPSQWVALGATKRAYPAYSSLNA